MQDRTSVYPTSGIAPSRMNTARLTNSTARPENELILLSSRRYTDAETLARIADLSKADLDWRYVLTQATRHGVSQLLYFNLRSALGKDTSLAVMQPLAARFQITANHNLYLLGQLFDLLEDLNRNGIAAIPLKGPVLAITAFGDVSLREFSDLDLLVRWNDVDTTRNRLLQLGFRCQHHSDWIEPYLAFGHELGFRNSNDEFDVDLQWRFGKKWLSFPLNPDEVWGQGTFTTLEGRLIRQPSVQHHLMILCGHGYRHQWSQLKWISDVAAFLHVYRSRINWLQAIERARRAGGLRVLGLGLWLAKEVGGGALPDDVARSLITDTRIVHLGRTVSAQLFEGTGPIEPHGHSGFIARLRFHMQARERIRDKLPLPAPLISHAQYQLSRYTRHYVRQWTSSLIARN